MEIDDMINKLEDIKKEHGSIPIKLQNFYTKSEYDDVGNIKIVYEDIFDSYVVIFR